MSQHEVYSLKSYSLLKILSGHQSQTYKTLVARLMVA